MNYLINDFFLSLLWNLSDVRKEPQVNSQISQVFGQTVQYKTFFNWLLNYQGCPSNQVKQRIVIILHVALYQYFLPVKRKKGCIPWLPLALASSIGYPSLTQEKNRSRILRVCPQKSFKTLSPDEKWKLWGTEFIRSWQLCCIQLIMAVNSINWVN